jgi:hypothetical protein
MGRVPLGGQPLVALGRRLGLGEGVVGTKPVLGRRGRRPPLPPPPRVAGGQSPPWSNGARPARAVSSVRRLVACGAGGGRHRAVPAAFGRKRRRARREEGTRSEEISGPSRGHPPRPTGPHHGSRLFALAGLCEIGGGATAAHGGSVPSARPPWSSTASSRRTSQPTSVPHPIPWTLVRREKVGAERVCACVCATRKSSRSTRSGSAPR